MSFLSRVLNKEVAPQPDLVSDLVAVSKQKDKRSLAVDYTLSDGRHCVVLINNKGKVVLCYDTKDHLNMESRILWSSVHAYGEYFADVARTSREIDTNRYHIFSNAFAYAPEFVEYLGTIYRDYSIQKLEDLHDAYERQEIEERSHHVVADHDTNKMSFFRLDLGELSELFSSQKQRYEKALESLGISGSKLAEVEVSSVDGISEKEDIDKVIIGASEAGGQTLADIRQKTTGFLYIDILERIARSNRSGWVKLVDRETGEPLESFAVRKRDIKLWEEPSEERTRETYHNEETLEQLQSILMDNDRKEQEKSDAEGREAPVEDEVSEETMRISGTEESAEEPTTYQSAGEEESYGETSGRHEISVNDLLSPAVSSDLADAQEPDASQTGAPADDEPASEDSEDTEHTEDTEHYAHSEHSEDTDSTDDGAEDDSAEDDIAETGGPEGAEDEHDAPEAAQEAEKTAEDMLEGALTEEPEPAPEMAHLIGDTSQQSQITVDEDLHYEIGGEEEWDAPQSSDASSDVDAEQDGTSQTDSSTEDGAEDTEHFTDHSEDDGGDSSGYSAEDDEDSAYFTEDSAEYFTEEDDAADEEIDEDTDDDTDDETEDSEYDGDFTQGRHDDEDEDDDSMSLPDYLSGHHLLPDLLGDEEISLVSSVNFDDSYGGGLDDIPVTPEGMFRSLGIDTNDFSSIFEDLIKEKQNATEKLSRIPQQIADYQQELMKCQVIIDENASREDALEDELSQVREKRDAVNAEFERINNELDEKSSQSVMHKHRVRQISVLLEKLATEQSFYANTKESAEKALEKAKNVNLSSVQSFTNVLDRIQNGNNGHQSSEEQGEEDAQKTVPPYSESLKLEIFEDEGGSVSSSDERESTEEKPSAS